MSRLSPYGTMAQGGNVYERQETDFDLVNDSSSSDRRVYGGYWNGISSNPSASIRVSENPAAEFSSGGFRVASSIPEPSTLLLAALATLGLTWRRRSAGRERT